MYCQGLITITVVVIDPPIQNAKSMHAHMSCESVSESLKPTNPPPLAQIARIAKKKIIISPIPAMRADQGRP